MFNKGVFLPAGPQAFPALQHHAVARFVHLDTSIAADDIMAASTLHEKIPPTSTGERGALPLRRASRSQSRHRVGAEPEEGQHLIGEFAEDGFLFLLVPRSEPQCSTGLMSYSEYS